LEYIKDYYDEEYIAHRKKKDWGVLTPFYNYAMGRHDNQKARIVSKYITLSDSSKILDIGCGAGTFLLQMRDVHQVNVSGVDFKDLSTLPRFNEIDFRHGLFTDQEFAPGSLDLITMWHFLEHDYDPLSTLEKAAGILRTDGIVVIEVPRLDSMTYKLYGERWPGLQAPQHTVLYDKDRLINTVKKAGLEVVDYLPYGAFPAYFYIFSGIAFKLLKGKGLNLSKAIYPYFLGQALMFPVLLFEKRLNLAMQTVVCRRSA
jgi:SAM-dependent methyltransferase